MKPPPFALLSLTTLELTYLHNADDFAHEVGMRVIGRAPFIAFRFVETENRYEIAAQQ